MVVAACFMIAGLLVWAVLYARHAALPVLAVATLLVGYLFGHSFWHADLGPLPLTLDRLLLIALAGLFALRCWTGRIHWSAVSSVDWALGATLVWLSLSAVLSRPGDDLTLPHSPMWRLLFSFWAPAFLFLVMRQSPVDRRVATTVLSLLTLLGVYLGLTALAETAGVWSLVFPGYIADPELGLHFGRARGPALNSVSLGVYLGVCFWAAWALLPRVSRFAQLAIFLSLPLMAAGVMLSYTRSTWIGLAAGGLAVLAVQTPRRLRMPVLGATAVVGVIAAGAMWQSLLYLEREDSGGVSKHSVQQRAAFAYVSWNMFRDHPLAGVGFGRFYDQKLPYLSDRSQSFELESIRDLHHHNTFLSLLTETGLIGMAAYIGVLVGLATCGWRLAQSAAATPEARSIGVLLLAAVMVYLPSAMFHDLTLLHTDQWLLLMLGGLGVGCERRLVAPARETRPVRSQMRTPAALTT